jgi:hypothetical protein
MVRPVDRKSRPSGHSEYNVAPQGAQMTVDSNISATPQTADPNKSLLREVVDALLAELKRGAGDRDRRRQVEEWMKSLAEKYPEFSIEAGLRDYYLAEARRLREEFDNAKDLNEKLNLGRAIESFLDKASDYERRIRDSK